MPNSTTEFTINTFRSILFSSLDEITEIMKSHLGIKYTMLNKLKFEKWFQIELLGKLLGYTSIYNNIKISSEVEISSKSSKKGKTIDLVIKKNKKKFIGIELKIIPTNYNVKDFVKKTKGITDAVKGLINDLKKCKKDGYPHQVSIGLFFPFPESKHRNYKDFEKQVKKMKQEKRNVFERNCPLSNLFISKYYILSNIIF